MSVERVRTFSDPFYSMSVALEGTDYLFEFRFNQRESAWYFDIGLTDGTMLVRGVKVVCNTSLLGRFAHPRLPRGMLMAVATQLDTFYGASNSNRLPGLDELGIGKRVTLFYFSRSEFV